MWKHHRNVFRLLNIWQRSAPAPNLVWREANPRYDPFNTSVFSSTNKFRDLSNTRWREVFGVSRAWEFLMAWKEKFRLLGSPKAAKCIYRIPCATDNFKLLMQENWLSLSYIYKKSLLKHIHQMSYQTDYSNTDPRPVYIETQSTILDEASNLRWKDPPPLPQKKKQKKKKKKKKKKKQDSPSSIEEHCYGVLCQTELKIMTTSTDLKAI